MNPPRPARSRGRVVREAPKRPRGRPAGKSPRVAILAATLSLLAEKGIIGLRVHEVARRARVAARGVYQEFGSRDELIVQVVQQVGRDLRERIEDAWARTVTDAVRNEPHGVDQGALWESTTRACFDAFFVFVEEHEAHLRVVFAEGGALPVLPPVLEQIYDDLASDTMRRFRLALPDRGADWELDLVAHGMVGNLARTAARLSKYPDVPRAAIVDAMVEQLLRGLRRLQG